MNILILCNGKPPPQSLLQECVQWAGLFIAADGGANVALNLGEMPDVVIGDMDSYQPIEDFKGGVIHDPDQFSNDLEKALQLAKKRNAEKVKVLGATGFRLDHSLKNLSVLKQFYDEFKQIIFIDEYVTIKLLPNHFKEDLQKGCAVSLFPLSGKVSGLTIRGLKYELTDSFLQNGVQDGSSNTVVSNPVIIRHQSGDLLLFINRKK